MSKTKSHKEEEISRNGINNKQTEQLKMKNTIKQLEQTHFPVDEYLVQLGIHDTVVLFKEITGAHYTSEKTETTDFIIEEIVRTDTNAKQFEQKMKVVFIKDHFSRPLNRQNTTSLLKKLKGEKFQTITKREMSKIIAEEISWKGINNKQTEQLKMKNFTDKRKEDHRQELLNDYIDQLKPNELIALFKELNGNKQPDLVVEQKVPNYPKTMLAIATLGAVCVSVFFMIRRDAPETTNN